MSVVALLYMRVFLPESMMNNNSICPKSTETDCLLEKAPSKKWNLFKTLPSVDDTICLLRTRSAQELFFHLLWNWFWRLNLIDKKCVYVKEGAISTWLRLSIYEKFFNLWICNGLVKKILESYEWIPFRRISILLLFF